jgi:hypothetical protein
MRISGATSVSSIHFALRLTWKTTRRMYPPAARGRASGWMLRCWTLHVQRSRMEKQAQTMSRVPRTLGTDVNFVFSGGREQVGVNESGMARGMHFADAFGTRW